MFLYDGYFIMIDKTLIFDREVTKYHHNKTSVNPKIGCRG